MCGRYQLQISASSLQAARPNTTWRNAHDTRHNPRQQVCPTTTAPVLISTCRKTPPSSCPETSNDGMDPPLEFLIMKWGFINRSSHSSQPLINARVETILELPTFRRLLFRKTECRRCAIPITAFYEWQRSPPPGKQTLTPYQVQLSLNDPVPTSSISYLAGLYDSNADDDTNPVQNSFVIVTTASSPKLSWLHARQPVFLSTDVQLHAWLDSGVNATDAVAALSSGEIDLTCTRMLKDLSAPAPKGNDMKQKVIASFFAKREPPTNSKGQATESETKQANISSSSVSPKKRIKPTATKEPAGAKTSTQLALRKANPTIRKPKNASSPHRKKSGQKAITSFFAKDKKDS